MLQISKNVVKRSRSARIIYSEVSALLHTHFGESGNELKQLQKLGGTKKGLPCFVFGNGPSLKILDIPKFNDFRLKTSAELFVVNNFLASEMARYVNPDHLVLSDPASFCDDYIAALRANGIEKRVDTLWIPAGKNLEEKIKPKNLLYFNDRDSRLTGRRNVNPVRPRGYVSMTAYKALAVAVYLGFDPIYLLGIDNSYLDKVRVDLHNRVFRTDSHFDSEAYPDDASRDYWPADQGYDLGSLLRAYAKLFEDLKLFPANRIRHLDPNSLVDAFPKTRGLDVIKI